MGDKGKGSPTKYEIWIVLKKFNQSEADLFGGPASGQEIRQTIFHRKIQREAGEKVRKKELKFMVTGIN